jgi:two-component system, chemotaxis family, sensor kinase CheA
MLLTDCPISTQRVDKSASRIGAIFNVTFIMLFVFSSESLFLYLLSFDFFLKAVKGEWSILHILSRSIVKLLKIKPHFIDAKPKLFAFRLGFFLLLVASLFAYSQWLLIAKSLTLIFVLLTMLEGIFGFCVGCYLYTLFLMLSSAKNSGKYSRIALFVLAYLFISAIFFHSIDRYIISEAEDKIEDILLSQKAIRSYINQEQKIKISELKVEGTIKKEMYDPVLLSSTYIARRIHTYYNDARQKLGLSDFMFKLASNNPLNSENRADTFELSLIERFNSGEIQRFSDVREIKGEDFLYFALPTEVVTNKCLTCHGDPQKAPLSLRTLYGSDSGYFQKEGEINAIISIYAPLDKELASKYQISLIMGSTVFIVLLLIFFLVERFIRSIEYKEREALTLKSVSDQQRVDLQYVVDSLALKNEEINNIVNSVKQGFIAMNRNLLVHEGYSKECEVIFGKSISLSAFDTLLYPLDKGESDDLKMIIESIFDEEDSDKRHLYISLLPEIFVINSKTITLKYSYVQREEHEALLVVVLTDISDKVFLEDQMEQERTNLNMVVKVVSEYNDFLELIASYQLFFSQEIYQLFETADDVLSSYDAILREIHTFKGSFSQFEMQKCVNKLHLLESELIENKDQFVTKGVRELENFISRQMVLSWIDEDIDFLRNILGEAFFERENIVVIERQNIEAIELEIENLLNPYDYHLIAPFLKRLKKRSFLTLLYPYDEYTQKNAKKLGKELKSLFFSGETILVDAAMYHGFIKALVHLFNNMVDHGLESPEERYRLGKALYGEISVNVRVVESMIVLTIKDDGGGIDTNKVAQKAKLLGIDTSLFTDQEIMELIFTSQMSTKEETSNISGRGIGLFALEHEVIALDGEVKIKSEKGCFSEFIFYLPLPKEPTLPSLKPEQVIEPLAKRLQQQLTQVNIKSSIGGVNELKNELGFLEYSALIQLEGLIDATFILSADFSSAQSLLSVFDSNVEANEKLCLEAIGESANLIIGNTLRDLPGLDEYIYIASPRMMQAKDATIQYRGSKIVKHIITTNSGQMMIALVLPEMLLEVEG